MSKTITKKRIKEIENNNLAEEIIEGLEKLEIKLREDKEERNKQLRIDLGV